MKARIDDFYGEIEWIWTGDALFIDADHGYIEDLMRISSDEIEELVTLIHGETIDAKSQIPQLKELHRRLNYKYEQIYISDDNGDYFNANGQTNNIKDRAYFHEVMKGSTVVSEPLINKSTKNPIIAVATPIKNERSVIGLFGVTVLLGSSLKGLRFLRVTTCSRKKKSSKGTNKYCHRTGLKNTYTKKAVQVLK